MRDFSIDLIWAKIQVAITAVGGWIGWFLGGVDGMLIALIVLMALDYLSGVMCAIVDKKLSSAVGFKGICKKVLILMLVGVANILDEHVVGSGAVLRGAVICFYLSNEALSLFLNKGHFSQYLPSKRLHKFSNSFCLIFLNNFLFINITPSRFFYTFFHNCS